MPIYVSYKKPPALTEFVRSKTISDHRAMGVWVDEVAQRMPKTAIGKFAHSMEMWHAMGALDQKDFERILMGKPEVFGKGAKCAAVLPPAVAYLLMEQQPNIMNDKEEFYRWLARPENAMYRPPR